MFTASRSPNRCLKNMRSTPTTTATIASALSAPTTCLLTVSSSYVAQAGVAQLGASRRDVAQALWSGAVVHYSGEFWFPVQLDDVWQLIEDFDQYQEWWPWLQAFTTDRAGLVAGNVLKATVVPPVPYRLRLQVRLHSCQRLTLTEATIAGDLRGRASLSFDELRGGTRVRATWTLEAASAPTRVAARLARAVVRRGHDWVVEIGGDRYQPSSRGFLDAPYVRRFT